MSLLFPVVIAYFPAKGNGRKSTSSFRLMFFLPLCVPKYGALASTQVAILMNSSRVSFALQGLLRIRSISLL